MSRPVTLFTGQWADLTRGAGREVRGLGLRRARARLLGDHFDVAQASRLGYCAGRRAILERHGLSVWAIGNHLVGQAVCDPIDDRHQAILRPTSGATGIPRGARARPST